MRLVNLQFGRLVNLQDGSFEARSIIVLKPAVWQTCKPALYETRKLFVCQTCEPVVYETYNPAVWQS